jgi:DNA-binding CsgD family transcriptional regulator
MATRMDKGRAYASASVGTCTQSDSTPLNRALLPVSDMATVVSISLLVRGRLILLVNPTVSANGLAEAGECAQSVFQLTNAEPAQLPAQLISATQKPAADLAPSTASIESSRKGVRASLTPRQLQVLALLGEGLSNKLICRRLKIAHGTVKVHIAGILRELGVSNRVQAVMTARRGGLLSELS